MNIRNQWLIQNNGRALIAGPCGAETYEQVHVTARQLAKHYPDALFRAGVWKPRTRPGQFEGAGEEALGWLAEVRKMYGLRVVTEVAIPRHVEAALRHGIDTFWIGARTTSNPFMVQEIAESLKGTGVPVLVKNPLHPDLQLVRGAVERLQRAGLDQLAIIHRGYYSYEQTEFRNAPRWELMLELRKLMPGIPVLCDISHIAGDASLLQTIAQQAADLHVDGFMIETHCDPSHALSDAKQQITPEALHELVSGLRTMRADFSGTPANDRVLRIRQRIDELDSLLLETIGQRMDLSRTIAGLKHEHQVSVLQMERWNEIIRKAMEKADTEGLYHGFVRNIFIQIHDESIRLQMALLKEMERNPDQVI